MVDKAKLEEWFALTEELPAKVAREKALRQELFAEAFPSPVLGTNRLPLGFGKDLKAVYKMSYTVNAGWLEEHGIAPKVSLARTNLPAELFGNVIVYKPQVSEGGFNRLSPEDRNLFGEFVTQRAAMPAMEIANVSRRAK